MIGWILAAAASGAAIALAVAWSDARRRIAVLEEAQASASATHAAELAARDEVVTRIQRAVCVLREGVVMADERGEVVFRNDVADELVHARHNDALVDAAARELLAAAVRDGRTEERTLELYGPPRRTVVVAARPLLDDGRAIGALAIIDDVTDHRRLEAIRRDFIANISHELKTPVGALVLLAETLAETDDPALSGRLAERMVNESTRLGRTIDDLLVLSRIEADDSPVREHVTVHAIVDEAVERIAGAAATAGIAIHAKVVDRHLGVLGDRRQLVSALSNLLENAVKYSDAGTEVEVQVTTDGRTVAVAVQDRGIGIPAKDIERVFQRFYRVDDARSRATGGTGLGLAIVRHVAANHDGEVTVESRLGVGSTFTLRLPVDVSGPVGVDSDPVAGIDRGAREAG